MMHLGRTSKALSVLTEEHPLLLGVQVTFDFAGLFIRVNAEIVQG